MNSIFRTQVHKFASVIARHNWVLLHAQSAVLAEHTDALLFIRCSFHHRSHNRGRSRRRLGGGKCKRTRRGCPTRRSGKREIGQHLRHVISANNQILDVIMICRAWTKRRTVYLVYVRKHERKSVTNMTPHPVFLPETSPLRTVFLRFLGAPGARGIDEDFFAGVVGASETPAGTSTAGRSDRVGTLFGSSGLGTLMSL